MVHKVPTTSDYQVKMIRRLMPADCLVVPFSTPVIAFGNPRTSRVATLAINPSNIEFEKKRQPLPDSERRLATLQSLGATDTSALSEAQVEVVVRECDEYFQRNPYMTWFGPLDKILKEGLGASYMDGSACHLDVVQWATSAKWSALPPVVRESLINESRSHLINQLREETFDAVVVNGASVWRVLVESGLAKYEVERIIRFGKNQTKCELRVGDGHGTRFIGWSSNIQSQNGANEKGFTQQLSAWLKEMVQ